MLNNPSISHLVSRLRDASPSGFAAGLHVGFGAPAFLLNSYPAAWADRYNAEGMLMRDPTVIWGMATTGTKRWSELEAEDRAGVLAKARAHGLVYGVSVSLRPGALRSLAGFARADREFTDGEIEQLAGLLTLLHEATEGLDALPPEEVEVLKATSIRLNHG